MKKFKSLKFKQISEFLEKRFPEILLILILLLISLLSIEKGRYILSNDNYSPELNPTLSVSRYLESPAWRGYRVLGFASESEQADVFRSTLFSILDLFLPKWSISQVFSLTALTVGTLSMAFLVRNIVRDYVTKKYSGIVFLISGVFYLTTLWTAWVFNFNMMPYVAQFGFLPLLLLSIYLLLSSWKLKNLLFVFLSLLLFTSSSVIATVFFVNLVLISTSTIYFGFLRKIGYKRLGIILGMFFISQSFWLIPFTQYTISNSQDIIDSYTNRAITANTIDLEAGMMTITNSARLYTRLLGTVDNPVDKTYIFPMSEDFMVYDIFKVVGLLPFIFSIIGLVFVILKKKWKLIPIWILLLGLLFLIKNQNEPFGGVYVWLQENIGLFKQVFRWVSSKLGQPYLIILSITSTIGFVYLLNFFASYFKKKERKLFIFIPLILLLSSLLFYSEYLFRGQLFTNRALTELPSQYYSLKEELSEDTTSRIFYAPPANNGYFREYEWGFVGSQFLGYILPNPLMDMSLAIGSNVGEGALLELTNDYNSGDVTQLNLDLHKYDVKYILVDRSLIKGRYGYTLDWALTNSYTDTWTRVWTQDFLELYQLEEEVSIKYIESYGENEVLDIGTFVRKFPQEPIFSPLNINLSNSYIKGNELINEVEYEGVDTQLYSNYKDLNLYTLPSHVKRSNLEVKITPSLPTVNGIENTTYKIFSLPSYQEYLYLVGESIFSQNELDRGVNIYNKWGEIENIYILPEQSYKEIDLTDSFSKTKPGDCSGRGYEILPDVIAENISSGFTIRGNSELPCLYNTIKLDKRMSYAVEVSFNWESEGGSIFGYCLYSSSKNGCLNKEKFLYTDQGFGDVSITIPSLIHGGDDISLTLYAINPKGGESRLVVRNVKLSYSSAFIQLEPTEEYINRSENILQIEKGETLKISIPVMNNGSSYLYTPQQKDSVLWQPSIAEDPVSEYLFSVKDGLNQVTEKQFINQYQELFVTNPLKRYLWYWSGENLENIPSTLCLTYVGDDKCFVDSTFYDDIQSSEARIFSSNDKNDKRLDVSFNSISFHNISENVLRDFVVMEIPDQWFDFTFKSTFPREYTEYQASAISNSPNTTFYKISRSSINSRDPVISIPQAKSNGWVAIGFTDYLFKVLPNSSVVYLDGWKQGWDISGMNYLNSVIIFYGPNFLSYLGYLFILAIFILFIFYLIKRSKLWRKITH